jgi:hypothetical protein
VYLTPCTEAAGDDQAYRAYRLVTVVNSLPAVTGRRTALAGRSVRPAQATVLQTLPGSLAICALYGPTPVPGIARTEALVAEAGDTAGLQ